MARALSIRRNAAVGFGAGLALAILAYVYRVAALLGPVPDQRGSPLSFLLLAFVLAVSLGALLTVLLTLRSAVRLARDVE